MGNLFGRKKQSRVTEQDRAILVRGRRWAGWGAAVLWGKLRREAERAALLVPSGAQLQTHLDRPRLGPDRAESCLVG